MSTALVAALGIAALALIAAYAVAVVIRFNQLTLARGLVREGWRQLELTLRERRELVPEFRAALASGGEDSDGNATGVDPTAAGRTAASPAAVELAEAAASESALFDVDTPRELSPTRPGSDGRALRRRARWLSARAAALGAAEHRLSAAVAAVWVAAERGTGATRTPDGCAGDLYAQLDRERARIEGATRLFNHHALAFNARLRGVVALPLRGFFRIAPVIPDGVSPQIPEATGEHAENAGAEAGSGLSHSTGRAGVGAAEGNGRSDHDGAARGHSTLNGEAPDTSESAA